MTIYTFQVIPIPVQITRMFLMFRVLTISSYKIPGTEINTDAIISNQCVPITWKSIKL